MVALMEDEPRELVGWEMRARARDAVRPRRARRRWAGRPPGSRGAWRLQPLSLLTRPFLFQCPLVFKTSFQEFRRVPLLHPSFTSYIFVGMILAVLRSLVPNVMSY
ncbi:unnamed protein product [Rangifer tarandus platyrhynchus]